MTHRSNALLQTMSRMEHENEKQNSDFKYFFLNEMPNHCCTIWNGDSCRTNFAATKKFPFQGGTVYRFPRDLAEQKRWELALPNVLANSAKDDNGIFKKHVVLCYKHFPDDVEMRVQPGGSSVPVDPPSIFGDTKSTMLPQTSRSTPRNPEKRNITAETRAQLAKANTVDEDVITNFSSLVKHCFDKFYPNLMVDRSSPGILKVFKLNNESPPGIDFSLTITDDFKVQAYRGHKKIVVRDLINGFTNKICKYSQVETLIEQLEKTPLDLRTELRACGSKILDFANEVDDDSYSGVARRTTFIGKQILLLHRRSYSKEDMLDAINLYLRSRNTYRALRDILTLPCPNMVILVSTVLLVV